VTAARRDRRRAGDAAGELLTHGAGREDV